MGQKNVNNFFGLAPNGLISPGLAQKPGLKGPFGAWPKWPTGRLRGPGCIEQPGRMSLRSRFFPTTGTYDPYLGVSTSSSSLIHARGNSRAPPGCRHRRLRARHLATQPLRRRPRVRRPRPGPPRRPPERGGDRARRRGRLPPDRSAPGRLSLSVSVARRPWSSASPAISVVVRAPPATRRPRAARR